MPWIGRRALDAAADAEAGTAPAAVVNEMTLTAQACAAPAFLRASPRAAASANGKPSSTA